MWANVHSSESSWGKDTSTMTRLGAVSHNHSFDVTDDGAGLRTTPNTEICHPQFVSVVW